MRIQNIQSQNKSSHVRPLKFLRFTHLTAGFPYQYLYCYLRHSKALNSALITSSFLTTFGIKFWLLYPGIGIEDIFEGSYRNFLIIWPGLESRFYNLPLSFSCFMFSSLSGNCSPSHCHYILHTLQHGPAKHGLCFQQISSPVTKAII